MKGYLRWIYSPDSILEDTEGCIIWQYRNYFIVEGVPEKVSIGFGRVDSEMVYEEDDKDP